MIAGEAGIGKTALVATACEELADGGPSVLVVEDLHWADDGTLDVMALLGRRLARARGCLILTCRSDALGDRPEVRRVPAARALLAETGNTRPEGGVPLRVFAQTAKPAVE